MISHVPIVFDEQAAALEACPLCYQLIWHEATAATLRATEDEVGKLKGLLIEIGRDDLLD